MDTHISKMNLKCIMPSEGRQTQKATFNLYDVLEKAKLLGQTKSVVSIVWGWDYQFLERIRRNFQGHTALSCVYAAFQIPRNMLELFKVLQDHLISLPLFSRFLVGVIICHAVTYCLKQQQPNIRHQFINVSDKPLSLSKAGLAGGWPYKDRSFELVPESRQTGKNK